MKKEPCVILTITPTAFSVQEDNVENLRPDQREGFAYLRHELRKFGEQTRARAIAVWKAERAGAS